MYWIENAKKVREANFLTSVKEAVNNVVTKLEKIELIVNNLGRFVLSSKPTSQLIKTKLLDTHF